MDALIFDFDGVVVDSEPIHLDCFRAVLGRRGIPLTTEDYYAKYVGFDDHDCFAAALLANAKSVQEREIRAMIAEKSQMVQQAFAKSVRPMPGALELMRSARAAGAGVAICTGGWRAEVDIALRAIGADGLANVVVYADDVKRGKPDPEGYLLTVRRLGEKLARPVRPERCWVVEDSAAGVKAARQAGCRVLAVTTSNKADMLAAADKIVASLADVSIAELNEP